MATEIRVPNLGESIVEATVGQWFKQAGDTVSAAEPLVELETDKVTVEVPAPASGVLSEIVVKTGETVPVGALLGAISEGEAQAKPAKAKPEAATLSLAAAEATAIVEEPALRAPAPNRAQDARARADAARGGERRGNAAIACGTQAYRRSGVKRARRERLRPPRPSVEA